MGATRQLQLQVAASGKDYGTFDDILQFAHIAWPIVVLQLLKLEFAETWARHTQATGGLFDEMVDQKTHVLQSVAQWGDLDWKNAKAVIQVEANATSLGLSESTQG